jgi:uncharacterized membrane protein
MPVTPFSVDVLRQRLPQLLNRGLGHLNRGLGHLPKLPLQKLPSQLPRWPLAAAIVRWVSWRTVATAVLLGGIVHICAIFAVSLSATGQAYRLLAERLPVNSMVVLPLQAPGRQILPFLPPDMLYAICRYDLTRGPVAVTAAVPDVGWALSLHTPEGSNIYVLPGQRRRTTDVSFLVVPTGPDAQPIPRREAGAESQIASPSNEGLAILRAPLRGLAWAAETEAVLQRATCRPARQ